MPVYAQARGEAACLVLIALCLALPWLEKQLAAVSAGGGGRRAAAAAIPGSITGFVYDKSLPEVVSKELAWAAYTCLRNTNSCTLMVVRDGTVALARGALASACATPSGGSGQQGGATLASVNSCVAQDLQRAGGALSGEILAQSPQDLQKCLLQEWQCIPQGCAGAILLPLHGSSGQQGKGASFLLVLSEFSDGWTGKDLQWLRNIAEKLALLPS